MNEKINLLNILKDCPQGMELDCVLFDDVKFEECAGDCIYIRLNNGELFALTKYGNCLEFSISKCVIFPKGKTTWEGFQRPFKDGDIVATKNGLFIGIIKVTNNIQVNTYCAINHSGCLSMNTKYYFDRLATEKEKQELFDAIKENGYKWNADEKKLEKLIEPKFKVGDRIKNKNIHQYDCVVQYTIREVCSECYKTDCGVLLFENQEDYELLPNKFDISSLKPFDKVLIRNKNGYVWTAGFFSHIINSTPKMPMAFVLVGGYPSNHCIPYEGNQHLLGTRNDCDEYYKTWEE